jgi:hypothetical protein
MCTEDEAISSSAGRTLNGEVSLLEGLAQSKLLGDYSAEQSCQLPRPRWTELVKSLPSVLSVQ